MKALVLGASGFVGPHLTAHLLAAGDDVAVADRRGADVCGVPGYALDITEPGATATLLDTLAPDAVYHLAGASDVGGSWQAARQAWDANATGTFEVLEACRRAGVGRVLLVGSADVYGRVAPAALPLDEDAPLRPVSPYAASKAAAEQLGLQAWLGHGLAVVRARPFNHLGPGQSARFVAPAIARQVALAEAHGADVVAVGDLSPTRDFTDVRDVVRAYRLLVERGEPGEVYNVCSGVERPVVEVAQLLLARSRRPLALEVDPARLRPVDLPALRGDNARLREATGWQPQVDFERTVDDVLADWRDRVTAGVA